MLFEYAVEPAAMGSSWQTFLYLIEKFGFDKGRLISRFPRKWERKVIEAAKASGMPEVRLASLVERLRRAGANAFIDYGRHYDASLDWLANAIAQHAHRQFRAVLARESTQNNPTILSVEEVSEEAALFAAANSWEVGRTNEQIAGAIAPLLYAAKRILIVDPYFDLYRADYRGPLACMLRALAEAGHQNTIIQIHRGEDAPHNLAAWGAYARANIAAHIPDGFTIEIYEWRTRNNGEDFHDRYLLCDCGGLSAGAGFSAANGNEHLLLSLLPLATVQTISSRFDPAGGAYDLAQRALRIDSNGSVTQI